MDERSNAVEFDDEGRDRIRNVLCSRRESVDSTPSSTALASTKVKTMEYRTYLHTLTAP